MAHTDNIILKRLLANTHVPISELDRVLAFYRTVLELEHRKEPKISTYYSYPLHFMDKDRSVMLIDLPCNAGCFKEFYKNKNQSSPRNLYIGLAINVPSKNKSFVVFGTTIEYKDLYGYNPNNELLPIGINRLSVDTRNINTFELDGATIDAIDAELSKAQIFSDIQELVHKYFGRDSELILELKVALSSRNLALIQISSELNKLTKETIEKNSLLTSFLTHTPFDNEIEKVSVNELIPVTALDDSQENVVAHALGNRFSVVTGPPGTGKTQVILNIIANALMRDKSVLIASKNNKAVDNVKERFDIIDPSQYLIRFGKKEYIETQTIPAITHIQQRIGALHSTSGNISSLLRQFSSLASAIREARLKLSRIVYLKENIPARHKKISELKTQLVDEENRHTKEISRIKATNSDFSTIEKNKLSEVDSLLGKFKRTRNNLQRKYLGFTRIWNNIFSRKKDAEIFLSQVEELPSEIKTLIVKLSLGDTINDYNSGENLMDACNIVIALLTQVRNYLNELETEILKYSCNITSFNQKLTAHKQQVEKEAVELESLQAQKQDLELDIQHNKSTLVSIGPQIIAAKIEEIERQNDAAKNLSVYKSYLPDNIPWKNSEQASFIQKAKNFLTTCRLNAITSLSVKSSFPLTDGLFDLLIIDEASQCDVASAIPLILRAKQVVVIGDPMQLKHITSIRNEEENMIRGHFQLSDHPYLKYVKQSLWDYSHDFLSLANKNSSAVTLQKHYRCHRNIIGYSNDMFYSGFLSKPLEIKTDEGNMTLPQKGVIMIDIKGVQENEHVNINRKEAERAISIAQELYSLGLHISIGIVTPFRDQADYIISRVPDELKGHVEVNTAHGFQGDEKDVMIYSLVVTDNSPENKIGWIDNQERNLVNVAVTRARQALFVVGNKSYIQRASSIDKPLGYLVNYASIH
ncbi:MAG: AAA family ATPase [Bacteroides heparinolyticus]|nr:AAA family ATPase [Bacteroides heparinolyticus]